MIDSIGQYISEAVMRFLLLTMPILRLSTTLAGEFSSHGEAQIGKRVLRVAGARVPLG